MRVVVLDKTGTITQGKPTVTDICPSAGYSDNQLLALTAAVESGSEHPLAQSVVAQARRCELPLLPLTEFVSHTALGVEGKVAGKQVFVGTRRLMSEHNVALDPSLAHSLQQLESAGKTVLLVAHEGKHVGLVAVADSLKPDSASAIAALHRMGVKLVMVTGDNESAARHVANQVGVDTVHAGVLPAGKLAIIRQLQANGEKVVMVGDGINDAPALKQASVGVAIGAGADIAVEAADVTLVAGELSKLVEAIRLSKASFRTIVENLFWASIYNFSAIPIAALGLLHPMIGVIAMTVSSLSVIGNAIMLKRAPIAQHLPETDALLATTHGS